MTTVIAWILLVLVLYAGWKLAGHEVDAKRKREAVAEHLRFELAKARVAYIAKLRNTLRKCEALYGCDYTVAGKALMQEIRNLTTAVDTNGKPLEKTDASNT
jgi:hypothetical protein